MSDQQFIVVNYGLLGDSASSLRAIGDGFYHSARIKDEVAAHVGSEEIADALNDFSDNWNRKRMDLTNKIRSAEKLVLSVMASFSEQDRAAARYDLSYQAGPKMSTTETGR